MKFRIGDKVRTIYNDGVIYTVVKPISDNVYIVRLEYTEYTNLAYFADELTLYYSPKSEYWKGFDAGYSDEKDYPSEKHSLKYFGKSEDFWRGFDDGVDFTKSEETLLDGAHWLPKISEFWPKEYLRGYEDGFKNGREYG